MEIETVSCPVCYSEFDQANHLPRVLPICGHTVCSGCLKIILKTTDDAKCPLDKIKFPPQQATLEAFPPNFMLNQVISSQVIHGICSQHNEPMRLVCLTDKCLACDECVYEGCHKGHEIKPVKKFKGEIDNKRSKLETSLNQVDSHSKQLLNLLEQGRLAMSQIVENRFKKIKLALSQKELEFAYEINSFFNQEKDRVEKLFGVESNLRADIAEKITKQKNFLRENIFDILEEDISKTVSTLDKFISKDCVFKLDQGLNNISMLLDNTLNSQPDPLPQWQFPIKDHLTGLSNQYLETSEKESLDFKMKEKLLKVESCLDFQIQDYGLVITVRQNMANIAVEINDWKHIKNVTLDLERYELSESDFETLYYVWNKLDSMTSLKLKFSGPNASDNDLFRVFPIFWKPKPLESLEIDLEKQPITDKSLIIFCEQILTKIPSLKSLIIRLWKTNITNNTLKAIAKTTLPALKALESFRLCLRNTKIDDEGLLEVFTGLLPTLKILELNIMETNTTDKSLHIFAQYTLPLMKKLDSLELLLWKTGVSDDSLSELFTNMQNVSALRLNLDSTNISNKSMEVFLNLTVPHMKALKELKIDLHDTKIDNTIVMKIREIRSKISH